ncbi:TetR/AcrR family transcriptional regulator [Brevibacillus agri]|uniref:TetR/AcrR family transcriptional regulator n=1 Tax=Brevibacillus agri TaxID=51101 RepID=UPI0018CD158E|nr:TetR/AcrR family transcriptional regulator [Brevibacillus agri]MBG9566606.1 transcriptional regulator [Brevibacillus agri]MED1822149.1 TetR/AcrR family transcriptional regulator [Brevibacillus agri]MED4572374.1 TetR/AcrR family transcriptional regulator [Brevibacillus agri]WHX31170.1 TetR/AcrR family transcriptional regulator [Brevibacillus agri]
MDSNRLSSSERLMMAAIDLIAEKGYNGVTTQEIAAAAGLSEKTLFRQFGSKRNLLESAFDRFHYTEEMTKLFAERLVWDLRADLLLVSRTYHELMNRNRKMIWISIKDEGQLPGFRERTQKHPRQLLTGLTNYFAEMGKRGKIVPTNPEVQATAFMMMNFGAFMNNLDGPDNFSGVSLEALIAESVEIFARALTP